MVLSNNLIERAKKKALQSSCRYKISAIGFSKKGDAICIKSNKPKFRREGGSIHAEIAVMKEYGTKIKTIVICRTNRKGNLRPIHPCRACEEKATELGIKILTIQ